MSVKIYSVGKDSPAEQAGILAGETLVSINSSEIYDVLDYRFYETEKNLSLILKDEQSRARTVSIRKGQYEPIGLEFETYLMDQQHSCRNKCVFCFIDQLPKGMRSSLYFKDDDSRLSFLFGNYVTLTNMKERDVERIIKMHISPINISVHTTNPELRVKMMGNRFAGESLGILYRLAEAGIKINAQLVLCRGLNDGAELERSLNDLGGLYPSVQSVAIVPVGLTRFRDGLYPLESYDRLSAEETVRIVERFGAEFDQKYGQRICYAADEFYLKAGHPIPPAEFYGDFDQLENGVGLMANLKLEFEQALEDFEQPAGGRRVTVATGTAAHPFLNELLDELRRKCHNLTCEVVPVVNDFFGHTINVAGLITGGDIIRQLKGRNLGDELILPNVMLRHEADVFLDDVTVDDLKKELDTKVTVIPNDGYELLNAIIGSDASV
jgi:Fe-S oxidoreductase, related to NifB/MoaA family